MNEQELKTRIEKKEKDIEKIQKRIAKWSKGLRPEDIAVCEPFGNCVYGTAPRSMNWSNYHGTPEYQEASKNYKEYITTHNDIPRSDDYNKGPNIDELHIAYRDLGEAKNTLAKYNAQLDKNNEFQNSEKIEVIWNFLQQWKEKAKQYFIDNAKLYYDLKQNFKTAKEQFMLKYEPRQGEDLNDWKVKRRIERNFEEGYFDSIHSLTRSLYLGQGKIDLDKLEDTLNKDIQLKYEKLVAQIKDKAGEIQDASNLRIDGNGNIGGTIKGSENTVEVWATLSGGYNVQIAHFRSYVRIV